MSYLKGYTRPSTPQSEPILGREDEQVKNAAGGYVFELDTLRQLRRWLILGSSGGTYYASEARHTQKNLKLVHKALEEHGVAAVQEIVDISIDGRAARQDEAIYALAVAASNEYWEVKNAALRAMPAVCRTATTLFMWLDFLRELRGPGLGLAPKRAVAAWYERDDVDGLAYQMVKYRERGGWTHKRAIQLSHPKPPTVAHEQLYQWALGRDPVNVHPYVETMRFANAALTPAETVRVIETADWRVPQEILRKEHSAHPDVWRALLTRGVPMNALVRNLGRLTSYGALRPLDPQTTAVAERLRSAEALVGARVHPVSMLKAFVEYESGSGMRSSWEPVAEITDALDEGFYAAFGAVKPANKRTMIAVDVSGSMTARGIPGIPQLSARAGAGALALVTAATEPSHMIVAFSSNRTVTNWRGEMDPDFYDPNDPGSWAIRPMDISPRMRLGDVVDTMKRTPAGGTDCAMPMVYATLKGLDVDTFIILTDNESWSGAVHPTEALARYRKKSGIDARLVVVAMTAVRYSVADPDDPLQMDVVGFDTRTPELISAFSRGEL